MPGHNAGATDHAHALSGMPVNRSLLLSYLVEPRADALIPVLMKVGIWNHVISVHVDDTKHETLKCTSCRQKFLKTTLSHTYVPPVSQKPCANVMQYQVMLKYD